MTDRTKPCGGALALALLVLFIAGAAGREENATRVCKAALGSQVADQQYTFEFRAEGVKITDRVTGVVEGTTNQTEIIEGRIANHERPSLAHVWPSDDKISVSALCHALLVYGIGPTDLPRFPSGAALLNSLIDEPTAVHVLGSSPFVITRNGFRYLLSKDPVFQSDVGEAHRDQCLSTFAALHLPLDTPVHLQGHLASLSDLLADSVSSFSFDQREPVWSAMAYAKYLPPRREWVNRFGERISFVALTRHLLDLNPQSQSCGGTHVFEALVSISNSDDRDSILDEETRKELHSYIRNMVQQVMRRQQSDGGWGVTWCDSIKDGTLGSAMSPVEYRLLITGHLLGVLNSLNPGYRPINSTYARAAEWIRKVLNSSEVGRGSYLICPLTHAVISEREAAVAGDEAPARRFSHDPRRHLQASDNRQTKK